MRPAARPRHFVALLVLAIVSASYAVVAFRDDRLDAVQAHAFASVLKSRSPDLWSQDPLFGDPGRWQLYPPLNRWALGRAADALGSDRPSLPFRLAVGPLALLYLCGMYLLLLRQCRSWAASVFVAILSSRVVETLGHAFWGVGSLGSAVPEGLFVAATPWFLLAYLRLERSKALPLVFLGIGLLGNVFLTGWANLTLILLLLYLVRRNPFRNFRWLVAPACLICAVGGISPTAWHYMTLRTSLGVPETHTGAAAALEALQVGGLRILYSDIQRSLLGWLAPLAVLVVPSAALLVRSGRYRVRDVTLWLWAIVFALLLSLGVHGLCLLGGIILDGPPPVIDFVQAAGLVMPAVYIFFAGALTSLFRALRAQRALLRWLCAILFVAWLLPSNGLRPVRHQLLDTATMLMDEASRPRSVQRHREQARAREELKAIARWAREHSDRSAAFLVDSAEFRMRSQRAIGAADDDVRHVYYLTPSLLGQWRERIGAQNALLAGDIRAESVRAFVRRFASEGPLHLATEWYVIARPGEAKGQGLEEVESAEWGSAYRLFRLP
jgi:hypothetical protein